MSDRKWMHDRPNAGRAGAGHGASRSRDSRGPAQDPSRRPASDEEVEIIDVEAADEAGVPLGDDAPRVEVEEDESGRIESASERELRTALEQARERAQAAEKRGSELREQLVRTAADFDNFRKRMERDRVEERKQAAASLVKSLLPVADSFGRALAQAEATAADNPAIAGFLEGAKLIETQLFDILKAAGLEAVDATGTFDPNVHEALMQEPSTERPHMSILQVFEPGYRFGGRLLRPARVKVAWNPEGAASASVRADDGDATSSAGEGSED
jgi:molecular chaperone GrpE